MQKDNQKVRTLRVATEKDFRSAIPYLASDYHSMQLVRMLYDGLLLKNSEGEIVPAVAKSYDISADKKIYTFHLKKTFWPNGDPVTAHDFAYSWKKMLDPKSGLPLACDFHLIKNGKKCSEEKVFINDVGIYVKDDWTLIVELEYPNSHFPSFVASPSYLPVHSGIDSGKKNKSENPVSNGPFLLKKWKSDYSITLVKNVNYWDAKNVHLDGIEIQIIPDPTTQLDLYDQGKLDYIGAPLSDFADPDSLQGRSFQKKETSSVACLMINVNAHPFSNKKLRQALSLALNRQEIIDHVLRVGAAPATGFLSGCLKLSNETYIRENKKEAKRFFAAALKELKLTHKNFPVLSISYRNLPQTAKVMAAIQQQWEKTLGIHIKLKPRDFPAHMAALFAGDYEIGDVAWCSKVEDPSYVLSFFLDKDAKINLPNWDCPEYRRLLTLARTETNNERRRDLIKQAEGILLEEMPLIPLYFPEGVWLQKSHLNGVTVSRLKEVDFKEVGFSSF